MLLRLSLRLSPWILGCVVGTGAAALGFDAVPGPVVLGAPLDLAIPVRVGRGEAVDAGCVRAEVQIGERAVDPADLAIAVEPAPGGAKLRLRSRTAVSEPLVTVQAAIDCGVPVNHRFVVLADPPRSDGDARSAPPAAGAVRADPQRTPGDERSTEASPAGGAARAAGAASAPSRSLEAVASPRADGPAPKAHAGRERVSTAFAVPDAGHEAPPGAARVQTQSQTHERPPEQSGRTVAASVGAGGDASPPDPSARASQQRLQALESEVEDLRSRNLALQQTIDRLRRGTGADHGARLEAATWLPIAALALLSTWLGVRWHAARRGRRQAIGHGSSRTPDAAPAARASEAATKRRDEVWSAGDAAASAARDAALSAGEFAIDDLIDLDQQVDFFVVLGEEDAARAMLDGQLDAPAGASPLAWLRLLGLLHRRADRDAYRRLGERFTARFGVEPPPWERGPESGRGLAGNTPLIEELQLAWPKPAAALRLLESVLRRRPGTPWLDLPALRDALLLYAVARDLRRRDETETPQVDLWLPLPAPAAADPSRR